MNRLALLPGGIVLFATLHVTPAYAQNCVYVKWLPAPAFAKVVGAGPEGGNGTDGFEYDEYGNPKTNFVKGVDWHCKACAPGFLPPPGGGDGDPYGLNSAAATVYDALADLEDPVGAGDVAAYAVDTVGDYLGLYDPQVASPPVGGGGATVGPHQFVMSDVPVECLPPNAWLPSQED
jgi:hypothetical protein